MASPKPVDDPMSNDCVDCPTPEDNCKCETCVWRRVTESRSKSAKGGGIAVLPLGLIGKKYPKCKLPLWDARHPSGFVIDAKAKTLDIWWGGYEYWIDLHRVDSPEKFLGLVEHISGKGWPGLTCERLGVLTRAMSQRYDWNIYGW
jgi:hypothetical protein